MAAFSYTRLKEENTQLRALLAGASPPDAETRALRDENARLHAALEALREENRVLHLANKTLAKRTDP